MTEKQKKKFDTGSIASKPWSNKMDAHRIDTLFIIPSQASYGSQKTKILCLMTSPIIGSSLKQAVAVNNRVKWHSLRFHCNIYARLYIFTITDCSAFFTIHIAPYSRGSHQPLLFCSFHSLFLLVLHAPTSSNSQLFCILSPPRARPTTDPISSARFLLCKPCPCLPIPELLRLSSSSFSSSSGSLISSAMTVFLTRNPSESSPSPRPPWGPFRPCCLFQPRSPPTRCPTWL